MRAQTCLFSLLAIFMESCNPQLDVLSNTKWIYEYGQNSKDYYLFQKRNKYEFYSAETGDTMYGHYELYGDTIIIIQKRSSFDYEFKQDSRHIKGASTYYLIMYEGMIVPIEDFVNGKWNEDYFFRKQ